MEIQTLQIENVVLFVGDAVRHDVARSRLQTLGPTFQTVTASLHTPASFASMLTGLNVPEHGVVSFSEILPSDITSLVDLPEWNTYFSEKTGTMHEDMHRIFQMPLKASIDEADEPFIWVVRDPGGHAPYNGYDPNTYDQLNETAPEYLHRVAGDRSRIHQDYQEGVAASIDRFEEVIQTIRNRGIEDETLLVYTSDHGELLGEYGMLGHNHVACPELVYTPTTFVHPSLGTGKQGMTVRHIDLLPTILALIDADENHFQELPGTCLWECEGNPGYNHFEMVYYDSKFLSDISMVVRSCWDGDGGHVFVDSSYRDALLLYAGLLLKSHKGVQIRRDRAFLPALRQLLPGHRTHGSPEFTNADARRIVDDINQLAVARRSRELDAETKRRLDDLGYL